MIDLGQKYNEPSILTGSSNEKYYPTIYLTQKQMKAAGLSAKDVGTECQMIAKVRVRSKSESENGGGSMDLDVVEASFGDIPSKSDTATILYGKDA